jgi:hypothetical protein
MEVNTTGGTEGAEGAVLEVVAEDGPEPHPVPIIRVKQRQRRALK